MQFAILGPLAVTGDDGAPITVGGPRPRALLVLLAMAAGRTVGVDRIVDGQYGEHPPAGAANAVQAHVSRLRRALGGDAVEFGPGGYRLAVDPDDVDVARFARLAADGRAALAAGRPADAARLLRAALALWRGDPLSDLPDSPATAAAVAGLAELRVGAAEDLAEAELALPGEPSIAELRELVAAHPLRERLRGLLVRALHAAGRQAEALAEYERVRRLLRAELGTDPSPELAAVHRALLQADRPAAGPRRRVPAAVSTFVGRTAELARLADLAAGARLVTVLGPGGTGKTRLVTEWAPRTACFVDLAPLTDSAQVPAAALVALGLREPGFGAPADPVGLIGTALAADPAVLVLDNCEHVLAGAAGLARAVLGAAPDARVVATSRAPLGVTGETLLPLTPLPVDDGAVELFVQRAAAVRPGFARTADVDAICAALDGLPLAIELAAARLRQLPVGAVAQRLAVDPFGLLGRGDPTVAERHRSLAAVVEWSWALLSPAEQQLAAAFAVFSGGATLDAVEGVCGQRIDELAMLVDHSLVTTDGQRYRMLEPIRRFCADRLAESGAEPQLRAAHAAYHLRLAQEADPHLRRAEQLDWLARLTAEEANLDAALAWAVEHDRPTAFRLVAALSAYWWLSGRATRGAAAAAALIAGPVPDGVDEEYVSCVMQAAPRAGAEHWTRAREVLATLDHPLRYPFAAALWGMTAGPPEEGTENYTVRLGADPWNDALMHLSQVLLGVLRGSPADGEREMESALATFRRLGDRWGTAQALDWLAVVDGWRGRWASAYARWSEALVLQGELGAVDECAQLLCHRAEALLRHGDTDAAEADLRAAEDLLRRAGRAAPSAEARLGLAEVTVRRGRPADAAALLAELPSDGPDVRYGVRVAVALGRLTADPEQFRQALADGIASPLRSDLADAVEGAAGGMASGARAAELLGAAATMRGLAIAGDPYVAATTATTRAELGEEGFAEAYARGAALDRAAADRLVADLLS
ncbi:BTAD domain-containing putative transcriptional regulator [Pseudonocardia sp. CA-107938]|uniref:BTAD domain-containing putative transcriptional regulator n=1 Tax=Pseudonocardia sp. CA-107938 TaxID=3240021 RepID=UPI003D934E51